MARGQRSKIRLKRIDTDITDGEIFALLLSMSLCQVALQEMREHPMGGMSQAWEKADREDGGEPTRRFLPNSIREGHRVVLRLARECGIPVPEPQLEPPTGFST